jgi:hypothetical protein
VRWAGCSARIREINAWRVLVKKPEQTTKKT